MKKIAVCLHDLRLSSGREIIPLIESLFQASGIKKLTVHLILDADPLMNLEVMAFFFTGTTSNRMEIVFHGATHRCSARSGFWLKWYHHGEAEFLGQDFNQSLNRARYQSLLAEIKMPLGICPPCWLMSRKGSEFLNSLGPIYLESLCYLKSTQQKVFSPVISLGSKRALEIWFLKNLGTLIRKAIWILNLKNVRLVMHTVDLAQTTSMAFLINELSLITQRGYTQVLQKEFLANN